MITPKERLEKVLNHQEVDRPPCICPGGMMNMVTEELMKLCEISFPDAHQNPQQMADLSEAVYKEGCFENYVCQGGDRRGEFRWAAFLFTLCLIS